MSNILKPGAALSFDPSLRPTQDTYDAIQRAYDEANWALFDGDVPNCLITLQRRPRTMGYVSPHRFIRGDGLRTHELALNPAYFQQCGLLDILSVLVHEMLHVWQEHHGTPGRGRYHNREFAEKSKSLGLYPSDTGQPGGKETGDSMSHYVMEDGPFERFARDMIAHGFAIEWREAPPRQAGLTIDGAGESAEDPKSRSGRRVKYTCPLCGLNAWARHGAKLDCHEHRALMEPA